MQEKLKSFITDDTIYIATLMVFVSVISFGLGRQSVVESLPKQAPAGVVFSEVQEKEVEDVRQEVLVNDLELVASKSGSKYHLLNCPGASQIKEENKVYFNSASEAQAAGYSAAANCPGV